MRQTSAKGNAEIILCIIHGLPLIIVIYDFNINDKSHINIIMYLGFEFCSAALCVYFDNYVLASFITFNEM